MDPKLDPKEIALVNEGNSLIAKIKEQSTPKAVLGPDGTPIKTSSTAQQSQVPSSLPEMMQRYRDAREMRILKSSRGLKSIFEDDEEAAKVRDIVFLCYQLIYWGKMELSGHEGMNDDMIDDLDEIIKASILANAKGYNLKQVVARLRDVGIRYLKEFILKYEDLGRVRKAKIDKVHKRIGEKGISLPGKKMAEACGTAFMPGRICMVVGKPEATRRLIGLIKKSHIDGDKGKVYQLSTHTEQNGVFSSKDCVAMPLSWWRNCCSDIKKRDEILKPVVDSSSLLLIIEDLETLYIIDDNNINPMERKSHALNMIVQWAIENLVAVVVADNPEEDIYTSKMYDPIPSVFVKLGTNNMLEVDGEVLSEA